MYTYTPVLIFGLLFGGFSALVYKSKQKRYSNIPALLSLVMIFFLFYQGHGVDVYFDAQNYVMRTSLTFEFSLFYEWAWHILCYIGNMLEMEFFSFRIIVVMLTTYMMWTTLREYTSNYGFPLVIYLCYFLYLDAMQTQNYIGMAIFIYSLKYLIGVPQRKNIIKYCLCIFVAAGFHTAYYVAFIYLILLIKNRKQMAKIMLWMGVGLIFLTFLNNNYIPIISVILQNSEDGRLSGYSSSATRISWIVIALIQVLYTFILFILDKNAKDKKELYKSRMPENEYKIFEKKALLVNLVLLIDLISFLLIPFNMMVSHMYRMIRNIGMLQYFCIFSNIEYLNKKGIKKPFVLIATISTVIVWMIFEFNYNSTVEHIVEPVLRGMYEWQ